MTMHPSNPIPSRSPPFAGSTINRVMSGSGYVTAEPSFTSGFGAVMEKEHELQESTGSYLGKGSGARSKDIDVILRDQQVRLGASVERLEQHYEMLPSSSRFQAPREKHRPPTKARFAVETIDGCGRLRDLITQHHRLLENIHLLIEDGPEGQHHALILTEVADNHAEMAWMLAALLKDDVAVHDLVPIPVIAASAAPTPGTTEGNWENEGGAELASPPRNSTGGQRVA